MTLLRAGDDLETIAGHLPYFPTQKAVFAAAVNAYAAAMAAGIWDWNRTATDTRAPMIVDSGGAIIAGHHRFLAAALVNVAIPEGVVKVLPNLTARPVRGWSKVRVL